MRYALGFSFFRETAFLVFLPASTGTRIVPSRSFHSALTLSIRCTASLTYKNSESISIQFAHDIFSVLILHICPDDVIRWYNHVSSVPGHVRPLGYRSDAVASAIADSYADRTLAIWKECAEGQISLTQPKAYQAAAVYLRKILKLLAK